MRETKLQKRDRILKEFATAMDHARQARLTWDTTAPLYSTREEWLIALAELLKVDFTNQGYPLNGSVRVSCGWPRGRKVIVGQCWSYTMSKDKTTEIFISPNIDDPIEAGAILAHELVHAAIGTDKGHGMIFRRCALLIGLTGKMTATFAGPQLITRLADFYDQLGKYPHAQLNDLTTKKQTTRLIKLECPGCGYVVRTTRQWIETGYPVCQCGETFQVI